MKSARNIQNIYKMSRCEFSKLECVVIPNLNILLQSVLI